ncbi:unnamed protein product [Amoebophrya sp. A120]|nr:unnamed protein product [Amoebophrya sp. A120]|eukprot:GSA120T00024499001.1
MKRKMKHPLPVRGTVPLFSTTAAGSIATLFLHTASQTRQIHALVIAKDAAAAAASSARTSSTSKQKPTSATFSTNLIPDEVSTKTDIRTETTSGSSSVSLDQKNKSSSASKKSASKKKAKLEEAKKTFERDQKELENLQKEEDENEDTTETENEEDSVESEGKSASEQLDELEKEEDERTGDHQEESSSNPSSATETVLNEKKSTKAASAGASSSATSASTTSGSRTRKAKKSQSEIEKGNFEASLPTIPSGIITPPTAEKAKVPKSVYSKAEEAMFLNKGKQDPTAGVATATGTATPAPAPGATSTTQAAGDVTTKGGDPMSQAQVQTSQWYPGEGAAKNSVYCQGVLMLNSVNQTVWVPRTEKLCAGAMRYLNGPRACEYDQVSKICRPRTAACKSPQATYACEAWAHCKVTADNGCGPITDLKAIEGMMAKANSYMAIGYALSDVVAVVKNGTANAAATAAPAADAATTAAPAAAAATTAAPAAAPAAAAGTTAVL